MDHVHLAVPDASFAAHRSRHWHPAETMKRTNSRSSTSSARPTYICPTPRRSRTTASHGHPHASVHDEPWACNPQYAWMMEKEIEEMARQNEETVRWILKQQERDMRDRLMFAMWRMEHRYQHVVEEVEEEMAANARYQKHGRDRPYFSKSTPIDADAALEEEIKRLQARKRETERCRAAYERRKALEEQRERERRKERIERGKAAREQAERSAWQEYETKWSSLLSSDDTDHPLTFDMIPWPLIIPPKDVDDLRPGRIAIFLFSAQHSAGQSRKDRIRAALRRWHPDRFGRILARVEEGNKAKVEEGAGAVVRCLNNLLERTT